MCFVFPFLSKYQKIPPYVRRSKTPDPFFRTAIVMGAEMDNTTEILVDPASKQHEEPQKQSPDAWIWDGVMDLANVIEKANGNPPAYPKEGRVPFTWREKCNTVMIALFVLAAMVFVGLGTAFFITLAVTESRGTSIFDEPSITFHGLNGDGYPYMTHRFEMRDVERLVCVDGCNSAPHFFPGFDVIQCTLEVDTNPKNDRPQMGNTGDAWDTRYVWLPTGRLVQWYEGTPTVHYAAWRCEWPISLEVYINASASTIVCDAPADQQNARRVWTQTCALYYSVTF